MTLVELATLKNGDVFLTKTSKLLVFDYVEADGTIITHRLSDRYYTEVFRHYTEVYKVSSVHIE